MYSLDNISITINNDVPLRPFRFAALLSKVSSVESVEKHASPSSMVCHFCSSAGALGLCSLPQETQGGFPPGHTGWFSPRTHSGG